MIIVVLSDMKIMQLLTEPKPEVSARALLRDFKKEPVASSRVATRRVPAADGASFVLRVRQSLLDADDFSVILTYAPKGTAEFILRRHNGPSHQHRNPIEGTVFAGVCHIHQATERYQLRGSSAEHYAEPTNRFDDMPTALACMLVDANFKVPDQPSLPGF